MTAPPTDTLVSDPAADQPAVAELRRRLDDFYARPAEYAAFAATPDREPLYRVLDDLLPPKGRGRPTRILELGAGRTGYPDRLRDRAADVEFDAQDVTAANLDYLRPRCARVFVGDVAGVPGEGAYDLILSTYVLEHVAAPGPFLRGVDRLLAPGGWHAIACPRYALPGYVPPSLRHLPAGSWRGRVLQALLTTSLLCRKPPAPTRGPGAGEGSDPA